MALGKLKAFFDKLTNDSHVPIAIGVFIVTFTYCAHTGKDIPPGFVSSLYAFYGFLGAMPWFIRSGRTQRHRRQWT